MTNNIFVYGPFFDMKENKKIAVGTGINEDFFMQYVLANNRGYREARFCEFKDLEITSKKDFYIHGNISENMEKEFKVGSKMYRRCKELFYLRSSFTDVNKEDELLGLFSGNNQSQVAMEIIKYLNKNNYSNLIEKNLSLESLGTKVDFGGLIALFCDKKE